MGCRLFCIVFLTNAYQQACKVLGKAHPIAFRFLKAGNRIALLGSEMTSSAILYSVKLVHVGYNVRVTMRSKVWVHVPSHTLGTDQALHVHSSHPKGRGKLSLSIIIETDA